MYASVRAFLDQIIDYAGLFPPAKLPLEEALRNYLHFKKNSPHCRMLGRFVCPAARLQDLLPLAQSHADGALLSLAALGAQSSTLEDFLLQLETALTAIQQFRRAWGTEAVVDTIEIPLPSQVEIGRAANYLGYAVEHAVQAHLRGFLETPMTDAWQDDVSRIAQGLAEYGNYERPPLGLKLRCGGINADAFPSDGQIAHFIGHCRAANLPWKATAGLHHPRRHWDEALQLWHHGFLNVFAAGVLAWNHALGEADLVEILADRELGNLRFDPTRMWWKSWECSTKEIAEARNDFATSFGSCSFEEPRDDLIALELLERDGAW
jgi:hypothetical protein